MAEKLDAHHAFSALSSALPRLLIAVGVGLLSGGVAAWAYYDDVFRPLSHTFGLWIVTVALLSARQQRLWAVAFSCLSLLAAVLAFYFGKMVMYGIAYPGAPYSLNYDQIEQWLVLALIAGGVLGSVFAGIGTTGRAGSIGAAAALGLLVADAYRRTSSYPADGTVVICFALLAAIVILCVAVRDPRQLFGVAAWTVPAALCALVLVSAPDLLEQFLITGSL